MDKKTSKRYAYQAGLDIEVVGETLSLPLVLFGEDIPIACLGRRDFFDRYLVLFSQRQRKLFLERLMDGGSRPTIRGN